MAETATAAERGQSAVTRRGLLLHDGLTFLALLAVALILFGVTFFLFQSFKAHREELGKRWSARGAAALAAGRPADAIVPLRAAISYAPDDARYQMLLAQALAGAGKTEEATNYFLNLWEARPGDGFINLQLARLARRRGESQEATEYYRAAVFGVWQQNGLEQRRAVRLELADYLMQMHDLPAARAELLTAAANAPDTPALDLELGDRLRRTGDLEDAMGLYRKAVVDAPRSRAALEEAGSTAYALGDYLGAAHLLRRAREARVTGNGSGLSTEQVEALAHDADRMVELSLSRDLPAHVRADHLAVAGAIAQARLATCTATQPPTVLPAMVAGPVPEGSKSMDPPAPVAPAVPALTQASSLANLQTQWKAASTAVARRSLRDDAVAQDAMTELIFATEEQAATTCGAPTGDDALLLKMAQAMRATERQQ